MYLDTSKEQYAASGRTPTHGCTDAAIDELERQIGLTFPLAYREFLAWAGRDAGELFHPDEEYAYDDLLELQTIAQDIVQESGFRDPLPNDMIVIQLYFGMQFAFISASEGADPPVYEFLWVPPEMTVTFQNSETTITKTLKPPLAQPPQLIKGVRFSQWIAEYLADDPGESDHS